MVTSKMPEDMARVRWNPIAAAKHLASMLDISEGLYVSAKRKEGIFMTFYFLALLIFHPFFYLLAGGRTEGLNCLLAFPYGPYVPVGSSTAPELPALGTACATDRQASPPIAANLPGQRALLVTKPPRATDSRTGAGCEPPHAGDRAPVTTGVCT